MRIGLEVEDLKVSQLIKILDSVKSTSSFLLTDYDNREFTFGELIKEPHENL